MKTDRKLIIKTRTEDSLQEIVLLENDEICEYKKGEKNLVGNIYASFVKDSMEGFNASFADIGQDRIGFIKSAVIPSGAKVLVQVAAAEHHQKGVSLTTTISLSGIYSVLMFDRTKETKEVRVSKNITDENRVKALKALGNRLILNLEGNLSNTGMRIILRTDSETAGEDAIITEVLALHSEYAQIVKSFEEVKGNPHLLRESDDPVTEMIRRYPLSTFNSIFTDDPRLSLTLSKRYPVLNVKTVGISGREKNGYDIFDVLNVSNRIIQLTGRRVWLKSGAYILIEPTEAMTVIDVNSGKCGVNGRDKKEANFLINKEAAFEIMRQLRLRNMGGIIICDFIDMHSREYEHELIEYMRALAKNDFEHPSVVDITKLGLAEITRKRS